MNYSLKNFGLCLIGGLLFYFLFYGKGLGISYPIFVLFFYGLFFGRTEATLKKQRSCDVILLFSILLLSSTFGLYTNSLILLLNFFLVPVLVLFHSVHTHRWDYKEWYNRLFLKTLLVTIRDMLFTFFGIYKVGGHLVKGRMNERNYSVLKKISFGFLIAVPLLWAVLSLLISADQHFSQLINHIPYWFNKLNLGSVAFQIGIVLTVSAGLFAYFVTLKNPLVMNREVGEVAEVKVDAIILTTILVLMNAVYFLYSCVQFQYFFTGDPSTGALGYTYAEYARRGFTELTLVTLINLGLLLVATHFAHSLKKALKMTLNLLLSLLVLFTLMMLSSAFFRLSLYEQAYGYTYSRVYAHAFMILLSALLVLALVKIWVEKVKLIQSYMVVSLIAYVVFNYSNVDQFIVKQNLLRYEQTGKIDLNYIGFLSYESVPQLIEMNDEKLNKLLKEKKEDMSYSPTDWQSYNLSKDKARELLDKWEMGGN